MRWVGARVSLPIVLLLRYAIQAAFMAAWIGWVGRHNGAPGFRTEHPRFQFVRGTLLLVSSALVFAAIRLMPLAEVTAITLLGPVLVTLLAGWVLHERVTRVQYLLVGVTFFGALVVVRPGSGIFGWAALLPLATAFSYAVFNLMSGRLAKLESPLTTNFYAGVVGTAWMLVGVDRCVARGLRRRAGRPARRQRRRLGRDHHGRTAGHDRAPGADQRAAPRAHQHVDALHLPADPDVGAGGLAVVA